MTHQEFDLSAFTNRVHERPDLDLVREMVTFLYESLIDAEATDHIGAEPQITLSKGMMFSEIVVESTGGRIITMQGMAKKDAERVKGFLDTGADSARNGGTTTIVQQIPTAAPAASLADELTKLAKLRDDGILTDEEFAEQKAVLMNRPPAS